MLLVFVALVFAIVTILCIIPGSIRFARTGSIREGIRVFALLNTVGAIGLGSYILAFVILMVIVIAFFLLTSVLALIPYLGVVIHLALYPLIIVFSARYLSRVYRSCRTTGTAGNCACCRDITLFFEKHKLKTSKLCLFVLLTWWGIVTFHQKRK